MLALLYAGKSARAVAREFNTTHSTVLAIKKRWNTDHTEEKKPRSGRPRLLSRTEVRYIVRMIKKDRSISWNALVDKAGGHVSYRTIKRAICGVFARKWKALDRPKITKEAAARRLEFARTWLPRVEELIRVMFSDEVTAANKSSNPNVFLFRAPVEKYNKDLVNLMDHVKPTISIMFWAAIWEDGRTPLVTMRRDLDSKNKGYSARSYRQALEEGLLPLFNRTREFQQDNSQLHNARATQSWLLYHAISWIDWPPFSPDLNPIEHAWALLKRKIRSLFPDLRDLKNNEEDRARFEACAKAAWDAIPQDQIRDLLESLPRRLRAVIRVRGWYTKY